MPGTHPAQEPPQPSGLGYLRELGPARGCDRSSPDPWESRMVTSAGTLPSLLLGTLLTFAFGALGANPGLVVRITDQGLEYGREPRLSAGLADPLGPRLLWGQLGTQRGLSLRVVAGFPVRQPWLGVWPCHPTVGPRWARCLS